MFQSRREALARLGQMIQTALPYAHVELVTSSHQGEKLKVTAPRSDLNAVLDAEDKFVSQYRWTILRSDVLWRPLPEVEDGISQRE